MRTTLGDLKKTFADAAELEQRLGRGYLIADPKSGFNIPEGPSETMRISLSAVKAMHAGEFHASTPVFVVRRRAESPYSFISVGRTENCDVCLPDESVSKLHVILREDGAQFTAQDAGSANGTSVNGAAIPARGQGAAHTLSFGDEVTVGAIILHFLDPAGVFTLLDKIDGAD